MASTGRVSWETLRTFDSATLSGSYQALGTPLANPSYIFKLVNNSTVLVTISIDGIHDIIVLPAGSFSLYDEGKVGLSGSLPALPANTSFFVKGAVAGTGLIYLETQYIVES